MKPLSILLFLTVTASTAGSAVIIQDPEQQRPVVRFGVVIDGPWDGNDGVRLQLETELRSLLQSDFDPQFPSEKRITAEWTLESVTRAVDQLLEDPDVDIFLAMGPVSSQVVAARTEFEKPAVAAFVLDATMQGRAGIVINNAIVSLDRIRIESEENGLEPARAVVEATQRPLRPILLTTATTVGGLLPLWFGGGPLFEPMAIAIIFGLLFATVLTLGLVPVLYALFFRVRFRGFVY